MSERPDDQQGGDELLDKLDQLLNRHRQGDDKRSVPTLDLPAATAQDHIPVLTDAVSGPALSRNTTVQPPQPEAAIENRLSAALSREVNRLQVEMPQYSRQLATLSATLAAAIRLLARRYLGEEPKEDPRPDDREPHP